MVHNYKCWLQQNKGLWTLYNVSHITNQPDQVNDLDRVTLWETQSVMILSLQIALGVNRNCLICLVDTIEEEKTESDYVIKQARKPRSYASPKLWPSELLTDRCEV